MIYTCRELAKYCNMSRYGFQKLIKKIELPHIRKKNKIIFDFSVMDLDSIMYDFYESLKIKMENPGLQVFYSLRDIAKKMGKHKDTVHAILTENDVPIHRAGRKIIVFLIDFQRLKQHLLDNICTY